MPRSRSSVSRRSCTTSASSRSRTACSRSRAARRGRGRLHPAAHADRPANPRRITRAELRSAGSSARRTSAGTGAATRTGSRASRSRFPRGSSPCAMRTRDGRSRATARRFRSRLLSRSSTQRRGPVRPRTGRALLRARPGGARPPSPTQSAPRADRQARSIAFLTRSAASSTCSDRRILPAAADPVVLDRIATASASMPTTACGDQIPGRRCSRRSSRRPTTRFPSRADHARLPGQRPERDARTAARQGVASPTRRRS